MSTLHISISETIYDETDSAISCQLIHILHLKTLLWVNLISTKVSLAKSLSVGVMASHNPIPRKTMNSVKTTDCRPASRRPALDTGCPAGLTGDGTEEQGDRDSDGRWGKYPHPAWAALASGT